MLDAYIIDEIKRRERERQQRERNRPVLEVPRDDEERREEKQERPARRDIVHVEL